MVRREPEAKLMLEVSSHIQASRPEQATSLMTTLLARSHLQRAAFRAPAAEREVRKQEERAPAAQPAQVVRPAPAVLHTRED